MLGLSRAVWECQTHESSAVQSILKLLGWFDPGTGQGFPTPAVAMDLAWGSGAILGVGPQDLAGHGGPLTSEKGNSQPSSLAVTVVFNRIPNFVFGMAWLGSVWALFAV